MENDEYGFCVALIQEDIEVGRSAMLHEVAYLMEIVHLEALPDGRCNLLALGVECVKITALDRLSKPYMPGSIEVWPEQEGTGKPLLIKKASDLFTEYARYLIALSGEKLDDVTLSDRPDTLSCVLVTALQVGPGDRQRLLETPRYRYAHKGRSGYDAV